MCSVLGRVACGRFPEVSVFASFVYTLSPSEGINTANWAEAEKSRA